MEGTLVVHGGSSTWWLASRFRLSAEQGLALLPWLSVWVRPASHYGGLKVAARFTPLGFYSSKARLQCYG